MKRRGLPVDGVPTCKECGIEIADKGRFAFCCHEHGKKYHRRVEREKRKEKVQRNTCPVCGKKTRSAKSLYCCQEHKRHAELMRRKGLPVNTPKERDRKESLRSLDTCSFFEQNTEFGDYDEYSSPSERWGY
jgi:hypothetical protein